jgi:hypothetical protein
MRIKQNMKWLSALAPFLQRTSDINHAKVMFSHFDTFRILRRDWRWSDITFELIAMIVFNRNDHSRPSQKNGDFSRKKRYIWKLMSIPRSTIWELFAVTMEYRMHFQDIARDSLLCWGKRESVSACWLRGIRMIL